jgi:four helix bundle protein
VSERPHKNLIVWQKSVNLAKDIYELTEKFPKTEIYGLVSQIRRAVISISSNIAEGCARQSSKEKIQFFFVARGSLSEIDSQIEISKELNYISEQDKYKILDKINEVNRLLNGLIKAQRRKL